MAFETVNFDVEQGNDWTLVATNPSFITIRIRDAATWQLCVTAAGAPTDADGFITKKPVSQEDGFEFHHSGAMTAELYVRVPQQKANQDPVQFGVIRDEA